MHIASLQCFWHRFITSYYSTVWKKRMNDVFIPFFSLSMFSFRVDEASPEASHYVVSTFSLATIWVMLTQFAGRSQLMVIHRLRAFWTTRSYHCATLALAGMIWGNSSSFWCLKIGMSFSFSFPFCSLFEPDVSLPAKQAEEMTSWYFYMAVMTQQLQLYQLELNGRANWLSWKSVKADCFSCFRFEIWVCHPQKTDLRVNWHWTLLLLSCAGGSYAHSWLPVAFQAGYGKWLGCWNYLKPPLRLEDGMKQTGGSVLMKCAKAIYHVTFQNRYIVISYDRTYHCITCRIPHITYSISHISYIISYHISYRIVSCHVISYHITSYVIT